ncbi:MAG TPA: enoyl-CoA hydratase/isomerase family protein [Solirubrobacterales bacterium]|nr:enoyl-CoA hydratase/isomerase family protein [Solirubrobacterales bacterium]
MPDYEHVLYEQDGPVVTITLNRPEVMNALSPELEGEMHAALDQADADDSVSAIVLTGAGKAFSAGYDMLAMDRFRQVETDEGTTRGALKGWWKFDTKNPDKTMHIMSLETPVIGAVNGWCLAGGFWIALATDITIASDQAVFGQPEVRQISNSSPLFALLVGWKVAHRYTLTGDHFDAEEALRIGAVNEVVPHDELLERAQALAQRIALVPRDSVRLNKLMTTYALEAIGFRNAMNVMAMVSPVVHSSRDAPEVAHFYQHRGAGNMKKYLEVRDGPFWPEPFGPKSEARPVDGGEEA